MGGRSMPLRSVSDKDVLTIFLTEAKILDAPIIEQIHQEMVSILEGAKQRNVLLDFGEVKFMSSMALGMLIRVNKICKEHQINLKLCNIEPEITQIFKITGMNKVFKIFRTAEDAYAGFQTGISPR
jgi:anti-anti-sigma factor